MLKIFAVRDVKADAYGNLICCPTVGLALRAFSDACRNRESPMAQYPDDYSLYELGTFDPASGLVVGAGVPVFVASAAETIAQARVVEPVASSEVN